jgi:hypothetical protein
MTGHMELVWTPLLEPGFHLVHSARRDQRHFAQELVHFTIHDRGGSIRWFDGSHCFDSYHMAEANILDGFQADHHARRVLIKRCLTAYQWETQMDKELEHVLRTDDVAAVLAVPYDNLFCHQELQDWEQEDYMRYNLAHCRRMVREHQVPILAFVDMDCLWRTHPTLASMVFEAAQVHWTVDRPDGRWRVRNERTGSVIDPYLRRQVTLLDFTAEPEHVREPTLVLPPKSRKQPHVLRN